MINFVGSAINRIPSIDIPSWVPKYGGNKFGIPNIPKVSMGRIPSLAVGTNFVKNDGLAMLHQGEAVVPKKYNPANAGAGQAINIYLDGRMIAQSTAPHMVKTIRQQLGTGF